MEQSNCILIEEGLCRWQKSNLKKIGVQPSEENLHPNFLKINVGHAHPARDRHAPTADTRVQCVGSGSAHTTRNTRMLSVACLVQVAEGIFGKN